MALPHIQQTDAPIHPASRVVSVATNLDYSSDPSPQVQVKNQTARIALYEDASFAPRIIDIPFTNERDTIGALAATSHTQIAAMGGSFPYRIILEACENLIHADFEGVVISIYDKGHTVVFSDQGPGIAQPAYALNTGFTSATPAMKTVIRGVGAGFTIMREYLESIGGSLQLDSNIGSGAVLTLRSKSQPSHAFTQPPTTGNHISPTAPRIPSCTLNARQKEVLAVLLKYEFVGPQLVAQTLGTGVATAHRDLKVLEENGLVKRAENKKSTLTQTGFEYVDYLSTL